MKPAEKLRKLKRLSKLHNDDLAVLIGYSGGRRSIDNALAERKGISKSTEKLLDFLLKHEVKK